MAPKNHSRRSKRISERQNPLTDSTNKVGKPLGAKKASKGSNRAKKVPKKAPPMAGPQGQLPSASLMVPVPKQAPKAPPIGKFLYG